MLGDDARDCLVRAFGERVEGRDDPRPALAEIERAVRAEGGFPLASCHGVMHTVGREYALAEDVGLDDLRDVLPRSNDPGCSAGFAHGVVTAVGPDGPEEAVEACGGAETRYRRYSCVHGVGHAFMRKVGGRLGAALDLCRGLGRDAADCGQGAFHDYWFAVAGVDGATVPGAPELDPRRLCRAQAPEFVRPCWYRAYVDNRPSVDVDSPEHLEVLCLDLEGLQRAGCITGVSVIGPADPAEQLRICAGLAARSDQAACVRGTKAQNLLGAPIRTYVTLTEGCAALAADEECYRWLGKAVHVLTDGRFGRDGCPRLGSEAARRSCAEGARDSDGPLETFS